VEIRREKELHFLKQRFKTHPIVAILGPRQCGKTTLSAQWARQSAAPLVHRFDLEDSRDLGKLENPQLALEGLRGLVIIDEIQRRPELFPILRVLADRKKRVQFLILGSASQNLLSQSSESLAGRISYLEITGFTMDTLPKAPYEKLWLRGGFPRSYLAKNSQESLQWREDFISTFFERDLPNLGIQIPAATLRKFWTMLAHYHGQIFNASEIGRSFSASDTTMKRYLDILSGTFLVRQLQPWFYNTSKRLIKRPKIYFRDSGILHALLSTESAADIRSHPKLGASWEGFALEQTIQRLNLKENQCFFWGVHSGAELDLVYQRHGRLFGIEFKYSDAPSLSVSMKSALAELDLKKLWVIYPGEKAYDLHSKVMVLPISDIQNL